VRECGLKELAVRRRDHRRVLLAPLEKIGITADDEVGVVSPREMDHVVIVSVSGQLRARSRVGPHVSRRGQRPDVQPCSFH
jgi:hypothetical protein